MSVSVAYDIWNELRRFLSTPDRADAADALVNVLIDNDYDAVDIKIAFQDDNDVKKALRSFLDDTDEELEIDDDDYDDD